MQVRINFKTEGGTKRINTIPSNFHKNHPGMAFLDFGHNNGDNNDVRVEIISDTAWDGIYRDADK